MLGPMLSLNDGLLRGVVFQPQLVPPHGVRLRLPAGVCNVHRRAQVV
jgi:hypothetical protein